MLVFENVEQLESCIERYDDLADIALNEEPDSPVYPWRLEHAASYLDIALNAWLLRYTVSSVAFH